MRAGAAVLLVDDDATVRDSLRELLESEGFQVITASEGEQAVKLAGKAVIDLVLLDLNLLVQDGWDVFEALGNALPLVPILIITARPNQLFTALAAGAGALLEKPVDIPVLLATMAELLAENSDQKRARLAGRVTPFRYQGGRPAKARRRSPANRGGSQ